MSDTLRTSLIRLAHAKPELRPHLLPLLTKQAMEFDTKEQLEKYLRDHPGADKSKHSVKKQKEEEEWADEGEDESGFVGVLALSTDDRRVFKKYVSQHTTKIVNAFLYSGDLNEAKKKVTSIVYDISAETTVKPRDVATALLSHFSLADGEKPDGDTPRARMRRMLKDIK